MNVTSIHAFAEKVALVSDGANPVGKAVALQLALQGAFVIVGVPASEAETSSVDELTSLGTLASSAVADPATETGAAALAGEAAERFGRLDLLVNCSALEPSAADDPDAAVRSVHLMTEAAMPLFDGRPSPRIVNLVTMGENAGPLASAADAAVTAMTTAYARSLPSNFRINAVRIAREELPPPAADELFRPEPRVKPDDAARIVLFLLSGESRAMNGQVITLD